jgi:leader peptidase (prepilin peptidase)/N-methyltransferase
LDLANAAPVFLASWLTVLGLIVGSFLNVVIARVPHGLSVVSPRSRCPLCGHSLSWFENIPVFSWLFLRARCRSCKAPISIRYPAIELLTGALYLACLARFDWTLELGAALVLVTLLVPLTFIDLEHWILPFELTIPGIVSGLIFGLLHGAQGALDAAIGAAVGFFSFWLLEWVGLKVFKKEALGGGDKYLLAMLGAFLTYRPMLGLIFLASIQGAIVGSLLLAIHGRAGPAPSPAEPTEAPLDGEEDWVPSATSIPYGPWLSLAGLEVLLLSEPMADILPETLRWFVGG